jgi:endonuclease G
MRAWIVLSICLLLPTPAAAATCSAAAYPVAMPADYEHTRWIDAAHLEDGDVVFQFGAFTAVFDGADDDDGDADTANLLDQPEWVAHEVKRYAEDGMFVYAAGLDRPNPWYEFDKFSAVASVPGVTNVLLDDSYKGEGEIWNRGHLATRNLVNRLSDEAGCNSHTFANAVPQFWSLNQGEWLALENYVGALANEHGRAWHISGPIFLPDLEIETIGESGEVTIPIPHAMFKVIVFMVEEDIYARAFIFHQPTYASVKAIMQSNGGKLPLMGFRPCRSTDQDAYDFAPFVSSLTEIENLTKITFFPA